MVARARLGRETAFPAGAVRSMVESADGRLWVLTAGGLTAAPVEHVDVAKISFRSLSQQDGMSSDNVLSLASDGGDGVWIGTSRGARSCGGPAG